MALFYKGEEYFPILRELYLPEHWTEDLYRLKCCGVPKERFHFKQKWKLTVELLKKILKETLPYEALVFDAGYVEIKEFLRV